MPFSLAPEFAKSSEDQLHEKNFQLSERNIQLAQEVQKLRQANNSNVKRVVEYSKRAFDATSENNRLKESLRRVSTLIERFLPVLVQGSNLMQDVVAELGKISTAANDNVQTNAEPNENENTTNSGELIQMSPQRTGIARPMVKGHSISKPSISLLRVVPRQTAAPHLPPPIRGLNLADMVRTDDRERPLNEVREQDADEQENEDRDNDSSEEHGSEENEQDSVENERGLEENEPGSEESERSPDEHNNNSIENDHNSEENDPISEQNEVDSIEIEQNSEDNESLLNPSESDVQDMDYRVSHLSVVEEESSVLDEGASEHSAGSLAEVSAKESPLLKDGAGSSEARAFSHSARQSKSVIESKPVTKSQSVRQSRKKQKRVEADDETSEEDEEKVELSLIKARCKLMNGDRRKELKEGTSKDYDAKGNFSPTPQRNRKRKKLEKEVPNAEEIPNETIAHRKSIDGLMSSLKKSRVSRRKGSFGNDSPRRLNGIFGDELHPRVSLVRMSSWRNLDRSVNAEEDGPRSLSPPFLPSLSVLLTPADLASPPALSPPATSPIAVTKRRRCSYVTTRNKRSTSEPVNDEAVVVLDDIALDDDRPHRSGVKRSNNLTHSISGKCSPADISSGRTAAKPATSKPRSKPKPKARSKPSAKSANAHEHSRKRTKSESSNDNESDSHYSMNPHLSILSMASSLGDAESSLGSPSRTSASSRPRRAKAPLSLKEVPLNTKMRRQ